MRFPTKRFERRFKSEFHRAPTPEAHHQVVLGLEASAAGYFRNRGKLFSVLEESDANRVRRDYRRSQRLAWRYGIPLKELRAITRNARAVAATPAAQRLHSVP
jgi:hypothetical protein